MFSRWFKGRSRPEPPPFDWQPGDLFSIPMDEGGFAVGKLLAVDEVGVHVRLYVERFQERPAETEVGELSLAPFGAQHNNPFSIGHMPIRREGFSGMRPERCGHRPVTEDELDGYGMWEEARGGYF